VKHYNILRKHCETHTKSSTKHRKSLLQHQKKITATCKQLDLHMGSSSESMAAEGAGRRFSRQGARKGSGTLTSSLVMGERLLATSRALAKHAHRPRSSSSPSPRRSGGAPPGGRSRGPELTSSQPPAHGVAQGRRRRRSSGHAARHRHRHKQQGIVHAEEQERAHAGGMSSPRGGTTRGGRPQQPDEQRGPARAWRGSEGAAR